MTFRTGSHVTWNTPQGRTEGVVVEKHTSDFEFQGKKFAADEDEPAYVVESDSTGERAAHKECALTRKG